MSAHWPVNSWKDFERAYARKYRGGLTIWSARRQKNFFDVWVEIKSETSETSRNARFDE